MEYNFANICRRIAQNFTDLADTYEENKQIIEARLDFHEKEIEHNNETKRKILTALQEDLNGI
jgi:hypothetical protein